MRTADELIERKIDRDDMTKEEELLYIDYWFKKYEEDGFDVVFHDINGQYPDKDGANFKIDRRCTAEDWDICCLPAWDIQFEDGTVVSAYPEEISKIEIAVGRSMT